MTLQVTALRVMQVARQVVTCEATFLKIDHNQVKISSLLLQSRQASILLQVALHICTCIYTKL